MSNESEAREVEHHEWCALIVNPQAEKCDCKPRRNTEDPESMEFWEFCDRTSESIKTPKVPVPLPLAQRILAALETHIIIGGCEKCRDVQAELREVMPK